MEPEKNLLSEPDLEYNLHTYADYLNFTFEYMVELIRGKIFKMTPAPSPGHQIIAGNLHYIIRKNFSQKNCQLFIAPVDVILPIYNEKRDSPNTVVQPDLCIICDPAKIQEAGCFGAPDLIIEILSPHTSKKDLTKKYEVYEESGVREYWIVFPKEEIVQTYVLVNSKFNRGEAFVKSDQINSDIFPNLTFSLDDIFT
ncbi:MAG: Uma2 family endonuclease [Saprospiraceae bacterium]|nr:Uma2 family endonuclease [Saprospiraceae bacterium]